MPLVPTGYGDSPYAAFSAFAGNPLLISLDVLIGDGLLDPHAFPQRHLSRKASSISPAHVPKRTRRCVRHLQRFTEQSPRRYPLNLRAFCARRGWWLDDFCLFHGDQVSTMAGLLVRVAR